MYLRKWQAGLPFALVAITGARGASAFGEEPAAQPQVKEQHALDLIKRMSDKLAGAKSFTFRSRSTIEAPGGTGQFLNFFAIRGRAGAPEQAAGQGAQRRAAV
jgi:hypothetical protein